MHSETRPTRPTDRSTRPARRTAATASWCGRPTTSASTTSPPATSSADRATRATGSGGTVGPTAAKIGTARLRGQLPDGDVDVLRQREHHGRRVRDLLPGLARARPRGTRSTAATSTTRVPTWGMPAGVRHHHQPRLDGVRRARLLGNQLGWRHRDRELPVRQQPGRPRHQHPDRRGPAGPRRTATARTARSAPSPTPTRAGSSSTTTATTTTTPTSAGSGTPGQGPIGHGHDRCRAARNDTVMDNTFADKGPGASCSSRSRTRACPSTTPSCPRHRRRRVDAVRLRLRPEERCPAPQHVHRQRLLREPEQLGLRRAHALQRPAVQLLRGQRDARRDVAVQPAADQDHLWRDHDVCRHRCRAARPGAVRLRATVRAARDGLPASTTGVVMHPLPSGLPTMPNPCSDVPSNAWCPGGKPV